VWSSEPGTGVRRPDLTALEVGRLERPDALPLEDATAPGRVVDSCNVGDVYQAVAEPWEKASAKVRQLLHALRPSQPECVSLFGSWARGAADALSTSRGWSASLSG